ncbi:M1 family metallopeptidase [Streptomyces somaliensis DSM 40738]|uniref:Aminopeptidase N n=1 Tax=Streptomyces somaliensis (strain ATCC 33201 / DSM 40738 / JCM 12659 / KCTC 9044 / NCTC 11332 / NRRL B-12077 / IP 733) TaxID=1134445 RepID=A0AA44DCB9_STRE0|nr:M1 family metallopeptidase [Streptomyces somaliensis]MCQ0024919.1 M1 family metallopeptidase [Streptomyces somaliensis DSM 40738]NKY14263.1 M1 family metallopeptidase [Streptomyces somaliensis DSM 40738]
MFLTSPRLRAVLLAAASAGLVAAAVPAPEPLGIGDPLFPHLGNPGYDVLAYDIAFTYTGDNRKPLEALTKIDARATGRLDRVNLDFAHGTVGSVTVDGRPAGFAGTGEDLVVEPDRPVEAGTRFSIAVTHTSDPTAAGAKGGWVRTSDGLAMANQADAAHRVFPCNDHPADKAHFTFRVTAPKDLVAVANGRAVTRTSHGPTTTWTYRGAHPMATELAQVSVGRSTVVHRTGPHGLPLRDVVPVADRGPMEPWLAKTPGHLRWMEGKVGRYPFETYGLLIADATTGFELETQTLSLFERGLFTRSDLPGWYIESIMVHELAHHWFGNSVTPRAWSDLWINEGHATWYEALYAEETGHAPLERRMRDAYTASDRWRAEGGPPAAPRPPAPDDKTSLFRPVVYDGSALVLYALRQEIGATAFAEIQRRWVTDHAHATAGTADFVRLASDVAGRDLTGFLHGWLHDRKTPPMPGHPDWRSEAPTGAKPA